MPRLFICCLALMATAVAAPKAAAEPRATLEPASGPAGTVASIRGTGFPARKTVNVRLGRRTLARVRSSRHGAFERSLKLPAGHGRALKLVSTAGRRRVSNVFEPSSALPPKGESGEIASSRARLRWDCAATDPLVQGFGFSAARAIQVTLDGSPRTTGQSRSRGGLLLTLGRVTAGRHRILVRAGSFSFAFSCTVPATSLPQTPLVSESAPIVPIPGPTPPPTPAPQPSFPIHAAFYYPWFPEAWNQQGIYPYTNYHPSLGFYSSEDNAVRLAHLQALEYAGFQAGIYSWWGQGHNTDKRLPGMLALTDATGSPIKWALYYEREGTTDPTVDQIGSDLDYIKANYASDPAFLKVDGKPVIFVYAGGTDDCTMADRWIQANTPERGFYVVLKVFAGYRTCTSQPQSWHQYAPSSRTDRQRGYSFAISPGFDLTGPDPERLPRDLAAFQQAAADMVASGEPWQLVISFNEWGENTATESAEEWASASGYGQYLDALAAL
jgi:hypothetical protein